MKQKKNLNLFGKKKVLKPSKLNKIKGGKITSTIVEDVIMY